jgi:membrane protein DedA with SNARE-associated domain
MSKKSKKSADQGTYALCITAGLILGVGLGPAFSSVLITAIIGGLLGAGAGYFFNHRKKQRNKH